MAHGQMIDTWDTLLEGPNMDFGYKNKQCWRGDPTCPINGTVTALAGIANSS